MISEKELFTMYGDCVLIRPVINKSEAKTTNLIRQNETDSSSSHFGVVISVSDEIDNANYKVDDTVIFDIYSAEKFVYNEQEYYIAHTKDIFAVMKGENDAK